MLHAALLGDSVFDNAAYIGGGPDVVTHLRRLAPRGWEATLRAVDGSLVRGVERQLADLPPTVTHVIVSAGGNDALGHSGLLEEHARSTAEVLDRLATIGEQFSREYREMLRALVRAGKPFALSTIYYPRFTDPPAQRLAVTALAIFNDLIIREAFSAGVPLLDLRLICNEAEDYANPIEPSVKGGRKIAAAIIRLLREHDFAGRRTQVFV